MRCHLGFYRKRILTIPWPPGIHNAPACWVNDNLTNFSRRSVFIGFQGRGNTDAHYLRESGPNYIKFVEDTGQSLRNKALVLDFTYLALFQHDSGWNASNVENRRYICTFDPLSVNSDLTGSGFRTFSASGQPHYTSVSNLNTIRLYIQLRYW